MRTDGEELDVNVSGFESTTNQHFLEIMKRRKHYRQSENGTHGRTLQHLERLSYLENHGDSLLHDRLQSYIQKITKQNNNYFILYALLWHYVASVNGK